MFGSCLGLSAVSEGFNIQAFLLTLVKECSVAAKGLKYSSSLDNYRNYGNLSWNDCFLHLRTSYVSWTWVYFKSTETQQVSCAPTQYGNEHSFGSGDKPVGLRSHYRGSERSSTIRNSWQTVCPILGDFAEVKVHISLEGWMIRALGTKPCCTTQTHFNNTTNNSEQYRQEHNTMSKGRRTCWYVDLLQLLRASGGSKQRPCFKYSILLVGSTPKLETNFRKDRNVDVCGSQSVQQLGCDSQCVF